MKVQQLEKGKDTANVKTSDDLILLVLPLRLKSRFITKANTNNTTNECTNTSEDVDVNLQNRRPGNACAGANIANINCQH